MSAFRRNGAPQAVPARRVLTLPVSAFAENYVGRPRHPVQMGLRLVGESTLSNAMEMAAKSATEAHPDNQPIDLRAEVYNDFLITNILAQACVHPHDLTAHFFAPGPEDLIRDALAPGGVRFLWQAYERFSIEDSPVSPEASDDDLAVFAVQIAAGIPEDANALAAARARRLIAAAIATLQPAS